MSFLNPLITPVTAVQVSGGVTASGGVTVSGLVGISGGGLTISGGVTVSGGIQVSGVIFLGLSGILGMSGATPFLSGAGAFSGAFPTIPLIYDFSGKQWAQWSTAISGSTVPEVHVASGNITTAVTTNISGQVVYLSPTTQSGNNYVMEVGTNVIFPSASGTGMGSNQSGGMVLASCGPIFSATLRSLSGNGAILVGGSAGGAGVSGNAGTAANVASPGVGVELFANESLTLKVVNTNRISVFNETAGTSGQRVTVVGILQT